MEPLNRVLRPLFDATLDPLASWPTWVGVVLWSIPVSVFALWVFKKSSDQDKITAVKDKIYACLFEIRLFNDDVRAIFRAQWEILGHVLHYQLLALKPMIWILPPVVLIMVHMHAFYGFRALRPGESTVVTATVNGNGTERPAVNLEVPQGVALETPGIWASDMHQMAWRVRAEKPGDFNLQVVQDGVRESKSLRVGEQSLRLSPERPHSGFLGQLEWPSEPPLRAGGPISSITVAYPEATLDFLGFEAQSQWAWMVLFFILTIVIALALKKPMGVEL